MNHDIENTYEQLQSLEKKLGDLHKYRKTKSIEKYYTLGWIFDARFIIYALGGIIFIPGILIFIGAIFGLLDFMSKIGSIIMSILCIYALIIIGIRTMLDINLGKTKKQYKLIEEKLKEYNRYFKENIDKFLQLEIIITKTLEVKENIELLIKYSRLSKDIIEKEHFKYIKMYINTSILFIILCITDLRSDLTIRITEQKKLLEGAKSEVEKNIQGTTELELVSELQKTRLDRQIEQFEELERVLVRV